jgi:hypothetical protein
MDSPLFLHIQHQFTTVMFLFLMLSKVKIFPNAAIHTKNAKYSSKNNMFPKEDKNSKNKIEK